MQDIEFINVTGAGFNNQYGKDWRKQIQGLTIDNPSGTWIIVQPLNRYIPPQVIGWNANIIPSSTFIKIQNSVAPAGGVVSALTGGPIKVQLFDYPVGENPGTDFTLQAQIANVLIALNPINNPPVNTSVTVTDVATLLRTTATTEALAFHNNDTTDTVWIGPSNVAATGVDRGYPLVAGGDFTVDLAAGISYYGICAAGLSADVSVQRAAIT